MGRSRLGSSTGRDRGLRGAASPRRRRRKSSSGSRHCRCFVWERSPKSQRLQQRGGRAEKPRVGDKGGDGAAEGRAGTAPAVPHLLLHPSPQIHAMLLSPLPLFTATNPKKAANAAEHFLRAGRGAGSFYPPANPTRNVGVTPPLKSPAAFLPIKPAPSSEVSSPPFPPPRFFGCVLFFFFNLIIKHLRSRSCNSSHT